MKFFKKIALLALTGVTALTCGIAVACDKEEETQQSQDGLTEYVYKISVQSEGGFGLKNVTVGLYDGNELVAEKLTSAQGNAYFTQEDDVKPDEYEVRISDLPAGWDLADDSIVYQTSNRAQTDLNVALSASLITDEQIPSSKVYALGDVMYDFSVQTSAGSTFTLSEVLEEKDMVLLNFWATWCGPCKSEFPAMQNAYKSNGANGELISDNVAILALSTSDDQTAVASFKAENGLSFDMAGGSDLVARFNTASIPVSIIVDRYGVISYWHVGSMTAASDFVGLFDKFIGDDYKQTVIGEGEYEGGGEGGGSGSELVKPNVSAPSNADVDKVLNANNQFKSSWDSGEYSWPFVIKTDSNNEKYLLAANQDTHGSYSMLNVEFTAKADDALFLDAWVDTELDADFLHIILDGTLIHSLSGSKASWQSYCAYVFTAAEAGKHTLTLTYYRDSNGSGGEDEVRIKNMRMGTLSDIGTGKVVKGANIFRYAATQYNDPTTITDGTKKTQYANYINPVFNETDGYYHVGAQNGPLLFADFMGVTQWNEYDLWQLAYNSYLVYDGMNLSDTVEDHAWATTNSSNGYVPVTEDIKNLLDLIAQIDVEEGAKADETKHLSYHDKEWLEMCAYYSHYGDTEPVGDPTRGVTFAGAIPIYENKINAIDCNMSLVPLGIKHKFTPTKSGVYHFYSLVEKEYEGTDSCYDPQCWIFDENENQIAYGDTNLLAPKHLSMDNFSIHVYLEKDVTYYALFAMFLNDTGKFDMRIDYVGETYRSLTNCAIGPYSYNEVTSETYVPDAITYEYDETFDAYYHDVDGDKVYTAEKDSLLYLDLTNATYLFTTQSLQSIIEQAYLYEDETKRVFYLNGKDYTLTMQKYLYFAELNNDELYGKAVVDRELMDIMLLLTEKYDGFGGIENSWQLMCYYYAYMDLG